MAGTCFFLVDDVGRLSLASRVILCVEYLVPLDGVAAVTLVCERVFRSGASALTLSLATAR